MQTNTAAFTTPTFHESSNSDLAWPKDPFQPAKPAPTSARSDRPRLIAPSYKWDALPQLIKNDPYLKFWNDTIFGNATQYYGLDPVKYFMDGSSGILDNAREIKMRIKAFAYVYRMTNDTKWVDRAFVELLVRRSLFCTLGSPLKAPFPARTPLETERSRSVSTDRTNGTRLTSSTLLSSPPHSRLPMTGSTMHGLQSSATRS